MAAREASTAKVYEHDSYNSSYSLLADLICGACHWNASVIYLKGYIAQCSFKERRYDFVP